jgi:hypothetical protein
MITMMMSYDLVVVHQFRNYFSKHAIGWGFATMWPDMFPPNGNRLSRMRSLPTKSKREKICIDTAKKWKNLIGRMLKRKKSRNNARSDPPRRA